MQYDTKSDLVKRYFECLSFTSYDNEIHKLQTADFVKWYNSRFSCLVVGISYIHKCNSTKQSVI